MTRKLQLLDKVAINKNNLNQPNSVNLAKLKQKLGLTFQIEKKESKRRRIIYELNVCVN